MSHLIQNACRKLQMPPTAKAVLMALASYADDAGVCWPSIAGLCEDTCFGRSAVIDAIKVLERIGAVVADRSDRYRTSYRVSPAGYDPSKLVRQADQSGSRTSSRGGRLVREPDDEVREPDTNYQEPSRTISKATIKKARDRAPAIPRPDDVDPQTWADWLALRKAKRAPVTETVLRGARAESAKAGMSLDGFLAVWCSRGSQGLQADWLKPHERVGRGPPGQPAPPSASANFRGKTYVGTPIDDLPPDLREAARAALAGG